MRIESISPVWSQAEASGAEPSQTVFWWLVRLRWFALAGVSGILLLAGPVLDNLAADSTPWLWATAGALAAYNTVLTLVGPARGPTWFTAFGAQIALDCIALAALVHFAGGVENPFLPLFVLHVVTANVVLSGRSAAAVLGLAVALIAFVVLGEGAGLMEHHCLSREGAPCFGDALGVRALGVFGGLVLTLVATSIFTRFLTDRSRQGQRRLVATVSELNAEKDRLAHARLAVETERVRLQAIIDCMGDAVTFFGPSDEIIISNQRARELWGGTRPAAAPQSLTALFNQKKGLPGAAVQSTFERGGRSFEATHSLVRSPQGDTIGCVMVARDITDRLAFERHIMHEEQMSVVGKLAAAVAHEINNPIGVICMYSQHALASLPSESPVQKHLETIRRNADNCSKIVAGMLNLARPHKPERRPVDLRLLCREVIESVHPLAMNAGVSVSSGRHKSTVPIWASADAGLLQQALLNLMVNAIEAVGRGGEVSIGAFETQDGPATAYAIEVRDTGPGIPPAKVEQIFQPFFTTKDSGTGLGLSIADNVVKSHDGRIEVESKVGAGTVFRIVLPDTGVNTSTSAPERSPEKPLLESSP